MYRLTSGHLFRYDIPNQTLAKAFATEYLLGEERQRLSPTIATQEAQPFEDYIPTPLLRSCFCCLHFSGNFSGKYKKGQEPRVFLRDELVVLKVKQIAVGQRRGEQEVYDDIVEAGMKVPRDKDHHATIWDSLSQREQQVTALACLGYRSYEIADMLGIFYETVRTHCKHIHAKFGLNKRELCLALKDWNFQEWLETNQI